MVIYPLRVSRFMSVCFFIFRSFKYLFDSPHKSQSHSIMAEVVGVDAVDAVDIGVILGEEIVARKEIDILHIRCRD